MSGMSVPTEPLEKIACGSLLEVHALERAGMPGDWEVYRWQAFAPQGKLLHYQLTGAVAPPKTRGPGKGSRNWSKMDKATVRDVHITPAEHTAWLAAWEEKTGKCCACVGTGKKMASASVPDGTTYRECSRCKGSGKAAGAKEAAGAQ